VGPTGVDWAPGVLALALGLILGGALVWWMRRSAAPGAAPVTEPLLDVRDLEERRDALFEQLRELDDTAAKRTPEQLARERYALELDAARVLQRLAALEGAPAPKGVPAPGAASPSAAREQAPSGFLAERPALRGFLWGTASMGFVAALVFLVVQAATPRQEGEGVTGTTPQFGGGAAQEPPDAEEAALRAAVAKDPGDVEARLELARVCLGRQDMMGVWEQTQAVLQKEPGHPRALSYQALVRLAMGQSQVALDMLKDAVARAPDLLEPHLHLALVQLRLGQSKEAEATMVEAERRFPQQAPMLKRLMAEMRERAAAEGEAPQFEGDPHAGVGEPGAAGGGARAEAAPAGPGIEGVLELDASVAGQVPAGSLVFVTVRPVGVEGGPPVAVKRLTPPSFPARFAIGPGDSMMGGELPPKVRIEARVDPDGDPLTRSPSDPSARVDSVDSGAKDVRLVLHR
jgi:cytochrome c-type biogenesis protein CcmH